MSAPRFFSRSPLALLLLSTAAALLVAGCTVPGSSRLEGPPKDLPPSLDLVTADVLGFWLYDADEESERLAALEGGSNLVPSRVDLGIEQLDTWVGKTTGMAVRELDVDGDSDTATLGFADVRSRARLEDALEASDWKRFPEADLPGPGSEGELWTRDAGDDEYAAAVVTGDAIATAVNADALRSLLESADEYAVPERKAMREFAVEARKRSPVAFVFRSDLIRTQVRRPFEDDPALLEFARWATDSNVLVAFRDGWLGLAPAANEADRDERVRVVGASEWVPDLAPDITLGAADPDLLAELGPDVDVAVALDDPGQHLRELVRAITIGAGQYVTEQDVADEGDRLELLPILDDLDGNAAIGYGDYSTEPEQDGRGIKVVLEDPNDVAGDMQEAIAHAGIRSSMSKQGESSELTVDVPPRPARDSSIARVQLARKAVPPSGAIVPLEAPAVTTLTFTGAGTPPRAPFLWFWSRSFAGAGETAGWMTFDGTDRVTVSADVALKPAPDAN